MSKLKILMGLFLSFVMLATSAFAVSEQVLVEIEEYVNQNVLYNPLKVGTGIWNDTSENQSYYNIVGYVRVSNSNPDGDTISDIYVSLSNTKNMTLPTIFKGRPGEFISNDTSSGGVVLHIPELRMGENSTWVYSVNVTNIRPPLNMTSNYSDTKVLAGSNLTVTDTLDNGFDDFAFQSGNTCIYNIYLTQTVVPVDFSGVPQYYTLWNTTTTGTDSGNVTYAADARTQYWDVLNGSCMNKGDNQYISYDIGTPINIPATTDYHMLNTTLQYRLNASISHVRVVDVLAISEATIDFEKRILKPSHPTLHGSNVTWNITGYFNTETNITYDLNTVTFWVSQRNVAGGFTDPNTIDNDTISGATLEVVSSPFTLINRTVPWSSASWLFNYSDIPSPIVWMDVNFTIKNNGTQIINRSVTQNGKDIYIKELYLIIGYWLEINKNITSIGPDQYHVRIDVHNKGNQVTPADTVVTIYDFVPAEFNITSPMTYSVSPWYSVANASNGVSGVYNGTLWQWGLVPTNILNTSFAQGPMVNVNTTWSVDYDVNGTGDYTLLDVFVTGLDPQQVDGAGSTRAVIVSEVMDRIKSTEGIFAAVASVLLLLGLLL